MTDMRLCEPDASTGTKLAAVGGLPRFGNKKDVSAMIQLGVRTVEKLMDQGMPHMKVGKRRCRFDLVEVATWFKQRFGQQRHGRVRVQRNAE